MYYLSIKNKHNEYEHFAVELEVYMYVRQLEECIKRPDLSKLRELYPERFIHNANNHSR
jgi:hypothetical protein